MYTIYETLTFKKLADEILSSDERQELCVFLANNPDSGDVIPNSGGLRKVRWSRKGMGKRGGSRVIYYNKLLQGEIWLLLIYSKSVTENIPSHLLKQIKEALND